MIYKSVTLCNRGYARVQGELYIFCEKATKNFRRNVKQLFLENIQIDKVSGWGLTLENSILQNHLHSYAVSCKQQQHVQLDH